MKLNIKGIMNAFRVATGTDITSVLNKEFKKISGLHWYDADKLIAFYNTTQCLDIDPSDNKLKNTISTIQSACLNKMREFVKSAELASQNDKGVKDGMGLTHKQYADLLKTKFFDTTNDVSFLG